MTWLNEFVRIGGFPVSDVDYATADQMLHEALDERQRRVVFFANTHFVVTCQDLRADVAGNQSLIILNDGVGLSAARALVAKTRFAENLNGTDFIPRFLRESTRPLRVYLLGAAPQSVQGAAAAFGKIKGVNVVGICDGYSIWSHEDEVIQQINMAKPDILLVGLGCPLQERWILKHQARLDVPLTFAVGALLDFMSGCQVRAPKWITKARLEWCYRLLREPRRLAYRYTIEMASFFQIVFANVVEPLPPVIRVSPMLASGKDEHDLAA